MRWAILAEPDRHTMIMLMVSTVRTKAQHKLATTIILWNSIDTKTKLSG